MAGAVVHFEIQASDVEKVVHFYTNLFGWEANMWPNSDNYWLVKAGRASGPDGAHIGIDGAIYQRHIHDPPAPSHPINASVLVIDVDDLEAACQKVSELGGRVTVQKQAIPQVGWIAYCEDIDHNRFGMMQGDPDAR